MTLTAPADEFHDPLGLRFLLIRARGILLTVGTQE
jgi:hypothetical protein